MSTNDGNPSQHPRLIGFIPPVSESPRYADNPFASREIALAWLLVLWRLFIGRYDTYAHRPLGNGRIVRVPRQLSNEVLWDHLRGNHVLYVYVQHHFQRGVKICVLDVDCHGDVSEDVNRVLAQRNFSYLEAVWRRLQELGLPVLLENSDGRGGLHLWMFVQNLSNAEAIRVAAWMDSLVDRGDVNVERFPRGNMADESHPGLCIRLPGSHHRQYHFSTFWNGEGWINGAAALAILNEIHPVAANELPEEALRFRAPIPPTRALPTTAPQHERADRAAPPLHVMRAALRRLGENYYTPRDEWLRVGMGLQSCVRTAEESRLFFDLWAEWSAQALGLWDQDDAVRDWSSFEQRECLFQWPKILRWAMAEGYEPPTCWHPDHSQQLQVDTFNAVPYEPATTAGEAVTIDVLREAVMQSRLDSLNQPGIFLDRSGTGSGKSTADLEIAANGHRILVSVPDHLNTNEIAEAAERRNLSAIRYPKRVYGRLDANQSNPPASAINCWNPEADRADAAGLAVLHSVCRVCLHRGECRSSGYLGQVEFSRRNSSRSAVILMTHRRAQLIDLSAYCRSHRIAYVAVHESLVEFLAPVYTITLEDLRQVRQLLDDLRRAGQSLERLGMFSDHVTSSSSQIARAQLAIQPEREGSGHERRESIRVWIQHAARIVSTLEATLTLEAATSVSVDLAELAFPARNYEIDVLHQVLWEGTRVIYSRGSSRQSETGDRPAVDTVSSAQAISALRLLFELTTGNLRRLVVSVESGGPRLVAVAQVELPSGIPVWLCDATADPEILARIIPGLVDRTPLLHVPSHHSVLQVPEYDISRGLQTGPNSTISKAVRHVLRSYPDKQNICVFCHSNHLEGIRSQLPVRVTSRNYFHSAVARGSNSLFGQHDLLVIFGTPRAGGPRSVVDRLIQIGDIDAINEPSEWGSQSFQITDRTRATRVIRSSRYGHPLWNAAYNSIVEAELRQIVGRARPVLFEGCDVVVVSSHLICSDFLEHPEFSLRASEDRVWQVCRRFEDSFAARDIRRHVPDLSMSAVRLALRVLRNLGYIEYCRSGRGRSIRYQFIRRSPDGRGPASDGCDGEQDSE